MGRATACFYGFLAGVLQDFSASILGYAALAKTIFGFIAGYFHFNEHYNMIKFINGFITRNYFRTSDLSWTLFLRISKLFSTHLLYM